MSVPDNKHSRRNTLLDSLSTTFAVIRDCQPLALGIHKSIKERMPDVDAAELRSAMRIHTATTRYLKALITGKERFDLDGNPAGEVTEEQREVASTTLRERFKKNAERKRAELKSQEAAQKAQEAIEKRQEKLTQLAARFNRR